MNLLYKVNSDTVPVNYRWQNKLLKDRAETFSNLADNSCKISGIKLGGGYLDQAAQGQLTLHIPQKGSTGRTPAQAGLLKLVQILMHQKITRIVCPGETTCGSREDINKTNAC